MAMQIDKKIEQLKSEIANLEAKREREAKEKEVLEKAYEELRNTLHEADISLDTFFRHAYRDIKRVVARVERERARDEANDEGAAPTKKAAPKKSKKRGRKAKAKQVIKIPAGQYNNIPPNLEAVHTVNEKGPRPKVIKNHVAEIGIDRFLEECRMESEQPEG